MSRHVLHVSATAGVAVALLILSGCGGAGSSANNDSMPAMSPVQAPMTSGATTESVRSQAIDTTSMLKTLDDEVPIGSTVVANGEQNPYGLDVAKVTSGKLTAGDLVICDFNDKANVQGTGSTIVALHPVEENKPRLIAQAPDLLGCNALALAPNDEIWTANFSSNTNTLVSSSGHIDRTMDGHPFNHPFGEAFAPFDGKFGVAAFYVSNAGDGTIVRINISAAHTFSVQTIAQGFAVNHGAPGSILGPSGLQYDARNDRLYIVDGTNNTVVMLQHVSTIGQGGIFVKPDGKTFSGTSAALGKTIFAGAPLNGPISSALLPNGNLAIGNTLDPNGKNLMVEITPTGQLLDVRNVDNGAAGAIFGMVATGTNDLNTKIYFNDDNANFLEVLER